MMRHDYRLVYEWILESDYDKISIVAPSDLPWMYSNLNKLGIEYMCYDIDPRYSGLEHYIRADPIFDSVDFGQSLVVNMNAHKMYPLGKVYRGEFIIVGTSFAHNGDCNIISSCDQLIEQNLLHTVYKTESIETDKKDFFVVWGRND